MTTQFEQPSDALAKRPGAMRIVRRYAGASAVAGLIPYPVLDVAALGGVHLSLIRDLTGHYDREFSDNAARNILIAIAASLVPGTIGSVVGRRALGALPFITPVAGLVTMSAFSAAASYGLGMIFVRHFEAGGTLDSFDLENLHRIVSRASA